MSYKDIDIQIENFKRDMARIGAKSFMIDENRIEFAIPASKTILCMFFQIYAFLK